MKISDLNYLEAVAEEKDVIGGIDFSNRAFADAIAEAIGKKTQSFTETKAAAVAGLFSSSSSTSFAGAKGQPGDS